MTQTITKSQLNNLANEVFTRSWEKNPTRYYSDCLKISPKSGDNCSLVLNSHQGVIQRAIDEEREAGRPARIIILKPRQTGISTCSCANLFHGVRFRKGVGMVVSKDLDSSEHIFSIVQRFHHYLPDNERQVLKSIASNRKELKFDEPHGGRIVVETAGKTSAGHSFTIRHLLLSEVSRWPEGCDDTIIGLLNAVPRQSDTTIIVESVANGMAGWFYQEWHKEDSDYVKIFLPWFEHTEYQKELPCSIDQFRASLEPEEIDLLSNYNLTLEQLEWRRWAIRNNCKGDKDKFKEQYPATPREAFIASGNTFFHIPTLDAIQTISPLRCDLKEYEDHGGKKRLEPTPNDRGNLFLWKRPEKGRSYVLGADVAEGIEIDGAPADDRHDNSSADVVDRFTGEQVAQLHGKITPAEFGERLFDLGKWYNWAYIGVEANAGYGGHVLETLIRLGYPADKIYRRQVLDETTRRMTNKLGWYTTQANRRSMMSALDGGIRAHELFINFDKTVGELMAFVTKPNGRIEAGSGQKDDRVFSLAIAYQMLNAAKPMDLMARPGNGESIRTQTQYQPPRSIYRRRASIYIH